MTRDEFERGYAERSGFTLEELRASGFVVRPCSCEEPGCKGWQMDHEDRLDFFEAHGMEPPP